jgi:hypothetical protein
MIIEAAVGALASELLKAITSEVGKDTYKKAKGLLDSLRKRFTGNPAAAEVIANYEQQPARYDADFRTFLVSAARSDPEFAQVLATIAKQLAAPTANIGTQNIHNETVRGAKIVSTNSAGRDIVQGNVTFGKPVDPTE